MSAPKAIRRLQQALEREARAAERDLESAMTSMAESHVKSLTGPRRDDDSALRRCAAAISRLSAAADLGGRLEVRFGAAPAPPEEFAAAVPSVVPTVAFEEALRDLEERDPIGAADLRRAGLEVEDAYGAVADPEGRPFYPHGFALARAADAETAKAVRDRLVSGMQRGETTEDVSRALADEWDWPASYARNVTRTTYNTATTAGRFVEARRVAAVGIPVGFKYQTAGDSNVRPGHAALDGLVARVDDPIWRRFSPPGGHQCRCVLVSVVGDEVPDGFVTVPPGASFEPGFGTRADLRTYG